MESLLDLSFDKVRQYVESIGEKSYRAKQIYDSLSLGCYFDQMTTVSKDLREKLKHDFLDFPVKIVQSVKSVDGTEKFLFLLGDGNVVEGVLMKYKYGYTLCISTQVGCRMNCAFCASGIDGLIRNLTSGEMLGEVISANAYLGGGLKDKRLITNVVLMGSGEPLDNYENVVNFLKLLSSPNGIGISTRNISLSTSGIVPKMYALADEGFSLNLTVSLHNPFDEERQKIMPIAKSYSIEEILKACDNYFEKTGRRYIFEYVLIKGGNDSVRYAERLIELFRGRPCHINLIRLNEVKEKNLIATADKDAYRFLGLLERGGLSATLRRRMGADIDGACGQLRRRYLSENKKEEIK